MKSYKRSSELAGRISRLLVALFTIVFPWAPVLPLPPMLVAQQTAGGQPGKTKAGTPGGEKPGQADEKSGRPAAPSLQAGNPELPPQPALPNPPVQLVAAAISGLGVTAASLKG